MAFTACPNCGSRIDPSAFPPGTRMTCFECGRSFAVGDLPRAAPKPESHAERDQVQELPLTPPPVAIPEPEPQRREPRRRVAEADPERGRGLAVGICLVLLFVVLAGIGYLISQADSGSRFAPSTGRFRPPGDKKMFNKDEIPVDRIDGPPGPDPRFEKK
jgi:hypothetical protein